MVDWSTDAVPARERFSYWSDVVCQTILNVSTESPTEIFSATIKARSFGDIRCVSFDCAGHELVRNRNHMARTPEDCYVVTLHRRGQSHFSQGDDTISLGADEIAIVDGHQPFRIVFAEPVSRATMVIPRSMMNARAPWLRSGHSCKIAANSPFAGLVRRHLLQLTSAPAELSDSEAMLLTDSLCNMLALATARDLAPNRMRPELLMEKLLVFCRHNMHDPRLSPGRAAAHFGISVRTLHARFQQVGQSFGRWVLQNRLEACSRALRDPYQRGDTVSTIAYRWGFNDLSYFNRTFRARFGMPPRQWRLETTAPDVPASRAPQRAPAE